MIEAEQFGKEHAGLVPLDLTAVLCELKWQCADCGCAGRHVASNPDVRFEAGPGLRVLVVRNAALHAQCGGGADRIPGDFTAVLVEGLADILTTALVAAPTGVTAEEAASSVEVTADRGGWLAEVDCITDALFVPAAD